MPSQLVLPQTKGYVSKGGLLCGPTALHSPTIHPPVFSHCGKFLFCVSSDDIKIFSIGAAIDAATSEALTSRHIDSNHAGTAELMHRLGGSSSCQMDTSLTKDVLDSMASGVAMGRHGGRITGVVVNPMNALQLLTCGMDGRVLVWDWSEGKPLHAHLVGVPVLSLQCHGDIVVLACQGRIQTDTNTQDSSKQNNKNMKSNNNKVRFYQLDVKRWKLKFLFKGGDECTSFSVITVKLDMDGGRDDGTTASSRIVIASVYKRECLIYDTKSGKATSLRHKRSLTCVTIHPLFPQGPVVAGDSSGRLLQWHPSLQDSEIISYTSSMMHWHAHAVASVVFSSDGTFLLSGGEEAVLVLWQLDTGHKQFLPRLGPAGDGSENSINGLGAISVSLDGCLYAIACGDNAVRVVRGATMSVVAMMLGMQIPRGSSSTNTITTTTTANDIDNNNNHHNINISTLPPTDILSLTIRETLLAPAWTRGGNSVITLEGKIGSLQFYDTFSDSLRGDFIVCPLNITSRTDKSPPPMIRIDPRRSAFSLDGNCAVTVEYRASCDGIDGKYSLKFWHLQRYNESGGGMPRYELSAQADHPHPQGGAVTSVAFAPCNKQYVIATAAEDGTFKLWSRREMSSSISKRGRTIHPGIKNEANLVVANRPDDAIRYEWLCIASCIYRDNLSISTLCFSHDGSTLAVACGRHVTLWSVPITNATTDQSSLSLRRVLTYTINSDPILYIKFIRVDPMTSSPPLLVAASSSSVVIWNLLTCEVQWSARGSVLGVAVNDINSNPISLLGICIQYDTSSSAVILLMRPVDATVIALWKVPESCSVTDVHQFGFVAFGKSGVSLVIITKLMTLWVANVINDDSQSADESQGEDDVSNSVKTSQHPLSIINDLYNVSTTTIPTVKQSDNAYVKRSTDEITVNRTARDSIFASLTHTLPPMTKILKPYLALALPVAAPEASNVATAPLTTRPPSYVVRDCRPMNGHIPGIAHTSLPFPASILTSEEMLLTSLTEYFSNQLSVDMNPSNTVSQNGNAVQTPKVSQKKVAKKTPVTAAPVATSSKKKNILDGKYWS